MTQQSLWELCGFDCDTGALTGICCREPVSGEALGQWLAAADFEALKPEITCMAAVAGASVRFSGIPELLQPRLRGIIKYVHTLNSGMMAGLCALGTALNRAGIRTLLLDETALYMRCPNGPQRHLWQMSLGVSPVDYREALEAAGKAGFQVEVLAQAAVARQGVTRQIVITPLGEQDFLWQGAQTLKKGTAEFLCPDSAALLIALGRKAFRALTKPNPRAMTVRWCMDMKLLLGQLSRSELLRGAQLAEKEHVRSHMCLLFAVYSAITGSCPEGAELFGNREAAHSLQKLLTACRALPEKGHRLRRIYLSCRLRRPDSRLHTWRLFLAELLLRLRGRIRAGS